MGQEEQQEEQGGPTGGLSLDSLGGTALLCQAQGGLTAPQGQVGCQPATVVQEGRGIMVVLPLGQGALALQWVAQGAMVRWPQEQAQGAMLGHQLRPLTLLLGLEVTTSQPGLLGAMTMEWAVGQHMQVAGSQLPLQSTLPLPAAM